MRNLLAKTLFILLLLPAAISSGVQANQSRSDFFKAIVTRAAIGATIGASIGAEVALFRGTTVKDLLVVVLFAGSVGGLGGAAIEIVKGIAEEIRFKYGRQQ